MTADGSAPAVPLPRYGEASLADLIPSILASLGEDSFTDVLHLPPARAACLLLVDGLGDRLLRAHRELAPVLTGAAERTLTTGFPSTTATSLACLGTGLPPGLHGIVGYQMEIPGSGRLLNALRWDSEVVPETWQPRPTVFEQAAAEGVTVTQVTRRMFAGSGLTIAALRGAEFQGADTAGELVVDVISALSAGDAPTLAYAYISDLDATGHHRGTASAAWQLQLELIEGVVEQLVRRLPPGSVLYVTGDHGMVDVPADRRIDVDAPEESALLEGLRLFGGEPRARHIYARPGAEADVLATWRARLGDDMWVVSRNEAIEGGWFGPVAPENAARIGDVVAAAFTDVGVVSTHREPHEARLVGHHGSLTASEQLVPLAIFSG